MNTEVISTIKEKNELQLHREISVRVDNRKLTQKIQELEGQLFESEQEKKNQEIILRLENSKEKNRLSSFYDKKLLEKQAEINDYKQHTLELLEGQKKYLDQIGINISRLEEERAELKLKLKEKEEKLFKMDEQYQKIKSTKIMKWVEQYWKLRKKIRLKKM